jgi:hypothetical protein
MASANLNLPNPSSGITTVTVKDKSTSNIVWQVSYDNLQMGDREVTFDGGVYLAGGFTVTATGSTSQIVCQVIGQDLSGQGGPSFHAFSPQK